MPEDLATALRTNPRAKAMFQTLTSANRYAILYRIGNAKKPETRSRRISQFVEMLARGGTIHPQGSMITREERSLPTECPTSRCR
ncbi:MAG: YdeI/OmpD-associated family protein [Acidimicrobiales bacterium]